MLNNDANLRLEKGVLWHTFFDGSGTVFFNEITGDTLGLSVTYEKLFETTDRGNEEVREAYEALVRHGFVVK